MTRHLLKLLWNTKRHHGLVVVEILLSFLVLLAVTTACLHFGLNWSRPLGFSWQGVWNVSIDVRQSGDDDWDEEMVNRFAALLREVKSMPEVESAAGASNPPYGFNDSAGSWQWRGREVRMTFSETTDDFAEVMKLELVEGRWFSPEDDAAAFRPIVLDREAATAFFDGEPGAGRTIEFGESHRYRVVGVVRDYRKGGEFSAPSNFVFHRVRVGDPESRPPRNILVRFRPGTTAAVEERLASRLRGVAPGWGFRIKPMEQNRQLGLRLSAAPILIGSVVAGFLILMVALGLTGVMWQNVTRRTSEIGLRRATGAQVSGISRQILAENLLITLAGVIPGVLLAVQLVATGSVPFISGGVVLGGAVLSVLLIGLITLVCGLYPARLAARVQPAEALHYE